MCEVKTGGIECGGYCNCPDVGFWIAIEHEVKYLNRKLI